MNNFPVNIELLTVSELASERLSKVTEMQIFGVGNNFHPQGLFSTEIFGAVGSPQRSSVFAYIDIHHPIIHPVIYNTIIDCKSFYKTIIDGTQTAIFNHKTGEFEKSQDTKANTGFTFFMQHIKQLKFQKNNSDKRSFNIDLFYKSIKDNSFELRRLLVMPAALRDYTVTPDGKPEEDEINSYYRRTLSQSQLIDPILAKKSSQMYDTVLSHIQRTTNELFDYLQSLLDGKNKLILGKWLSRKVFNSTRNVLTAPVDTTTHITDPNRLRSNEVAVGLYQFLRTTAPKSLYHIKNDYASKVFIEGANFAYLTNAKTLKKEEVLSSHVQRDYDRWMTMDGVESVIASYANHDIRDLPISLNNGKHYMGLLYNDTKQVMFLQDITELPQGLDPAHVSPITLTELLYMSVHHLSGKLPGLVTRYPISGYGSIYPAWMKLRTTSKYHRVKLLTLEAMQASVQEPTQTPVEGSVQDFAKQDDIYLECFPVRGSIALNGMTVHQSHLAALGADFDGDVLSLTGLVSDEAIEEAKRVLSDPTYYTNIEKKVIFSNSSDVINAVLTFLTAD